MRKIYPIFIFIIFLTVLYIQSIYAQQETVLHTQPIYAQQQVEISPEKPGIVPWGQIKLQYDDNVFLDRQNEKSDFIVTLTPGATAYLPFSNNLLTLDYHVDFNRFMQNTSQNATNHYLSGNLELNWSNLTFRS